MDGAPGIVVLGGINMDLVTYSDRFPSPGETVVGHRFLTYAGGKGANQAVAAARMGGRTSMVGQVGGDLFGPQLLDGLREAGVDVSGIAIDGGETSGIAVIGVDGSAQNRIVQVLGANSTCGAAQAEAVASALTDASTLMLQLEVPIEVSLASARKANAMGKTVILDPGPVRPIPEELIELADVITPNETEAAALVGFPVDGHGAAERAAEELLRRGARTAIIKLGSQGAIFATGWQGDTSTAFPVEAVDTVAAGDAFNGALAVCLAEGRSLERAVMLACAAGALAVTTTGAQDSMPTRAEVVAFLGR
ncbi:Ribokinase [Geodia barretti]|uniref:Ribokinase n=1 Tax=Geodia barretti TaxID=519541 RepID=A0AA35SH45_GEOBA|nr:Ribokinase [Geodia barretti]